MWVDCKPVDDEYRSMQVMLIHESRVFELRVETKFEVCETARDTLFKLRFNPQFKYMTFIHRHHIYREEEVASSCFTLDRAFQSQGHQPVAFPGQYTQLTLGNSDCTVCNYERLMERR